MVAKPRDIREARAYLQNRGFATGDIKPVDFAGVSDKLQMNFNETLKLLTTLALGGQGGTQFEQTKALLEAGLIE